MAETHEHFPCENCSSITYKRRDGQLICTDCNAHNADIIDDAEIESTFAKRSAFTKVTLNSSLNKEASESNQNKGASRPWFTIEALQQILRGKVIEICQEREIPEAKATHLMTIVKEMWMTYLKGRLLCFTSDSNPVNYQDRDRYMYLAVKNDGFNGFDTTNYDPLQYKKTPKRQEDGIYSAGNTTFLEFTSSDSAVESQIVTRRSVKRRKKAPGRKNCNVSVTTRDLNSIIFMAFRMVGEPISFNKLQKDSGVSMGKRFIPSHIIPTSVDRFLTHFERFEKTESNFDQRETRHRENILFVYLHMTSPVGEILDPCVSTDALKSLIHAEVASVARNLNLASTFQKFIERVVPFFIEKILKLSDSTLKVVPPYIDI